MEITEFIAARLADKEAWAHDRARQARRRGAAPDGWPDILFREVAAMRSLVGSQLSDHAPVETMYGLACRTCVSWQDDEGTTEFGIAIPSQWPCMVARSMVAGCEGHPDFDPAWTSHPCPACNGTGRAGGQDDRAEGSPAWTARTS